MSKPKDPLPAPLNPSIPQFSPPSGEPILIRRARLFEGHHIGRIAARTYYNAALMAYMSPRREQYYGDFQYGFATRAQGRMFSPRNLTYFAYEKSKPECPVGYMQFVRMGDDEAARKLDREWGVTWRLLVRVLQILWGWWVSVNWWWRGGNRSEDPEAVKTFIKMTVEEDELHWKGREDAKNRWHAQSVVVLEEYSGRGIGKRLMAEVLGRADSEGVITGLEASESGEWMYRSVGFELLSRFQSPNNFEGDGGGVMIRYPKGWKAGGVEK
ncbi:hypothetical protein VTL71DRAFT_5419 [Oculimacula yallundae]|uniref:N-acetyltransferase domain-containing protein n=1 Tax=Oculimacula yallundae TaxID=86028 RepID=A0ABR4C157_9HELO